ncbi:MAG: large conductance mechanosensitive channel protein MscL [Actinobacteria bacterium]|nr:large conductance mechanosensitive channel protein MscL [Actinomycetota bacterium]
MIQEFRDFVNKGNFVDIAVAFVVGAAFGRVVTTFTDRVVSPLIAMVFTVPDLSDTMTFGSVDPETGLRAGSVGAFVAAGIDFVIVAFVMFLVVRSYNRFTARHAEPSPSDTPAEPDDVTLLREIRDLLAASRP